MSQNTSPHETTYKNGSATISTTATALKATRVRYGIMVMLFFMTAMNYADRATLSITGTAIKSSFGLSSVTLGYMFSAFAWTYVIAQIPGGRLLDRYGSRRVYAISIFLWSILTFSMGFVAGLPAVIGITALFVLRILIGLAEAPAFPGNSRIVATWFPASERGTTSALFTSASYFATVVFAPVMGWVTQRFGWQYVYLMMGTLGMLLTLIWLRVMFMPKEHPRINQSELDYITAGGALVDMDSRHQQGQPAKPTVATWPCVREILSSRMMLGILIGQYCVTTLTYFFLTWFPIYLVQDRGMSILKTGFIAVIPAICGFIGGVLGGVVSDRLIKNGVSITWARKIPIVFGMLLSTTMIICNYLDTEWLIVAIMAMAFFGKGFGAQGWGVMSDVVPKQASGLAGSLFNGIGNIAGITTPIIIGYLVNEAGNFSIALSFVAANALGAIVCYLLVVGPIKRLELKKSLIVH
ncbi:ACS family glucarate transporter-like MFS transporter [Erwinia toletana]|uniref:ACS family glucarate transporter-like MFS transporter n=1 Tax=Winslowiella toletana TaxID=92490 RepID=A0ABS4PAM6_9GAMM|nr:MFS transporter [Winslowiella toletana]MBP2169697.1 ACS family glucarate transporter-like MFS transporter [Winslowiella toletana]